MRKFIFIFCAVLAVSCTIEKSSSLVENPEYSSSELIYQGVIEPLLHSGELLYFFDEYQTIRDDREKALKLYRSRFGEPGNETLISFETVSTAILGRIVLQEQGYKAYTDQSESVEMYVQADGTRWFSFHSDSKKLVINDLRMMISGSDIITELDISYVDSKGTIVSVKSSEPLSKPVADGKTYCTPNKGTLIISLKGDSLDDIFQLVFNGPTMSIIGSKTRDEYKAFFTDNPLFKRYENK